MRRRRAMRPSVVQELDPQAAPSRRPARSAAPVAVEGQRPRDQLASLEARARRRRIRPGGAPRLPGPSGERPAAGSTKPSWSRLPPAVDPQLVAHAHGVRQGPHPPGIEPAVRAERQERPPIGRPAEAPPAAVARRPWSTAPGAPRSGSASPDRAKSPSARTRGGLEVPEGFRQAEVRADASATQEQTRRWVKYPCAVGGARRFGAAHEHG